MVMPAKKKARIREDFENGEVAASDKDEDSMHNNISITTARTFTNFPMGPFRIPNVAKVSYVSQTPSFVLNENIEREKDEEEPNIFIL